MTAGRASELGHAAARLATLGLCVYEAGALASRRVPTLTELSCRHRMLAPALVAALVIHLWRAPRVHIDQVVIEAAPGR
jgi:hypothetical protein